MNSTATATHVIALTPASEYRSREYGILLESETDHGTRGGGWHNKPFHHRVEVWENRPSRADGADPDVLVDPFGKVTGQRYTYLLSAQASVITAHPSKRRQYGPDLAIGDTVELQVNGLAIGTFTVTSRPLCDPVLVRVD